MASTRDIKRRIRSVKNINQITKAMEVVSMTKMRRSQLFALAARPYASNALDMLKDLLNRTPRKFLPDILCERPAHSAVLVVITADKGLVGGFNDAVLRQAENWIQQKKDLNIEVSIVAVGKKAKEYFQRQGIVLAEAFSGFGDHTAFKDTQRVADSVLSGFHEKKWDEIDVVYTHFRTTLKQETKLRKIVPAREESLQEIIEEIIPEYGRYSATLELEKKAAAHSIYNFTYIFEPSPEDLLANLATLILKIAFHHVILESNASEHSARMVTMKNASDNASELKDKLTLQMNKARQAGITAELSEIIAGAEALS